MLQALDEKGVAPSTTTRSESDDPVVLRGRVADLEAEVARLRARASRETAAAPDKGAEVLRGLLATLRAKGVDAAETERLQTVLTQEMSHRVKNNLQLVVSLLQLQLRSMTDPDARSALEEASARVATIAQVHDQLWRHDEVQSVDLTEYLRGQCERTQGTAPTARILFAGEPVSVASDRAVPLALLANELVSNALKHAYPDGAAGEVRVRLGPSGAGHVRLEISDRGVGLPQGFEMRRSKSFGMRLVTSLVRQVDGELAVEGGGPGTSFVLTFPHHSQYEAVPTSA